MDEKPLRETLLDGAKAGTLLQVIYACSLANRDERDELSGELATLHNEGLVDVVAAFKDLKNNTTGGPDFFLTRHVFEKTLPHLNAPTEQVIHCVLRLCDEAGRDMAAGTIFNSYIEFCVINPERPREALKLIEAAPGELINIIPATIAAGSQVDNPYFLAELLRFIRHHDIEVRRRAVFSVSRMFWPKGGVVPEVAITTLEETIASETDDRILSGVIRSAFALYEHDQTLEKRVVDLIDLTLAKGNEFTLNAASELLWLNTKNLPNSIFQPLFTHLRLVKPENTGTLNNIDLGIANLLKREEPTPALRFLEELLTFKSDSLQTEILDSTAAEIRETPALISKVLTRWFLSGEPALNLAVYQIVGTHHNEGLRIEIDASELRPADQVHIRFIARKAIGWFFMQPVTAASVVISLMRHAPDDETLSALGELLLDPLLMNYPGSMRSYVEEQAKQESSKTKETIENALAAMEQYLEVLHAVPELPALYVSQSQRESYRRYMSDSMAESRKAAEEKSIFTKLFSRSTLLYGNKVINYVHAGTGEPRRMETPLTRHSVSIEFPRMENIDHYGLDYMLRVFRHEQFRA